LRSQTDSSFSERRGVLISSGTADPLRNLDLKFAEASENGRDVVSTRSLRNAAREFRLTAYDAVFLQNARQQELPLATLDRQLLAAASEAGVEIVR
jgi:predicted nucleic acid-binding protein